MSNNNGRHLYKQSGIVKEILQLKKAIVSFKHNGQEEKGFLGLLKFIYEGKTLEATDSFYGKLKAGDTLCFDCHIYDKESYLDCSWVIYNAYKLQTGSVPIGTNKVTKVMGYIQELHPGKGVIRFAISSQPQRALFIRSKFYYDGHKPGAKYSLSEFLDEDDVVVFDAESIEATLDNKMCSWLASVVHKTTIKEAVESTESDLENKYTSVLPAVVLKDKMYQVFEANSRVRDATAHYHSPINEECGVAFWRTESYKSESIFFHRQNLFVANAASHNSDDSIISIKAYAITDIMKMGVELKISAVQAIKEFPTRWIARQVVLKL